MEASVYNAGYLNAKNTTIIGTLNYLSSIIIIVSMFRASAHTIISVTRVRFTKNTFSNKFRLPDHLLLRDHPMLK